jgi:hypothetical protein
MDDEERDDDLGVRPNKRHNYKTSFKKTKTKSKSKTNKQTNKKKCWFNLPNPSLR